MPRFLLLVSPERRAPEAISPEALGHRTQAAIEWIGRLRREGSLRSGTLLAEAPYRLSCESDEREPARIEGAGAPIRQCFFVEAETMDVALKIAAGCPSAYPGTVDVFRIEADFALSPSAMSRDT